jgi:hypothetical protein
MDNALFYQYQPLVLRFANTKLGKSFLGIEGTNNVDFIDGASYHQKGSAEQIHATVISGDPFYEKLYPALTAIDIASSFIKNNIKEYERALYHYLGIKNDYSFPLVMFDSFDERSTSFITIWDGSSDSNSTSLSVGENPAGSQVYRNLHKFDLSSVVSGSTVSAATLTWMVSSSPATNSRTCNHYRMLRNWTSAASWATYDGSNNWTTAGFGGSGTDRSSSAIGSWTTDTAWTDGETVDTSITTSEMEAMITTNYGIGSINTVEDNDLITYYSNTHETAGNRPRLEITYTLPAKEQGHAYFM